MTDDSGGGSGEEEESEEGGGTDGGSANILNSFWSIMALIAMTIIYSL